MRVGDACRGYLHDYQLLVETDGLFSHFADNQDLLCDAGDMALCAHHGIGAVCNPFGHYVRLCGGRAVAAATHQCVPQSVCLHVYLIGNKSVIALRGGFSAQLPGSVGHCVVPAEIVGTLQLQNKSREVLLGVADRLHSGATRPISIYYFAQFPNYFMLSNLSVIALSFLVIVTGVALLPISFIPFITKYLSLILTWEIRIMNRIIVFIERLPHAVTRNMDYHIVQVILLYGVIGFICLLLYRWSRKVFWTTGVLFTLFVFSFSVKKEIWNRETEFMPYHIRKGSALSFHCRGQTVLFSDSIRSERDKLYQYNIRTHARKHRQGGPVVPIDTAAFDTPFLCKRGNFVRFCDKTYYLLTHKQRIMPDGGHKTVAVDCLLLRQNPRQPPEEVMEVLPFREVVADGSNTPFYIDRWRFFCEEKGIPFTYTGDRKL